MTKEQRNAYAREWRARNKDRLNRQKRERNKEHERELARAWKQSNPGWHKQKERRYKYGLSHEDYVRILTEQEGMCPVCKIGLTEGKRTRTSACVDHCHETHEVRGILCRNCNAALGGLDDDPMRVSALLEYVGTSSFRKS